MTDLIIVNKSEGSLFNLAKQVKLDYQRALSLSHGSFGNSRRNHWFPKVLLCSTFESQKIKKQRQRQNQTQTQTQIQIQTQSQTNNSEIPTNKQKEGTTGTGKGTLEAIERRKIEKKKSEAKEYSVDIMNVWEVMVEFRNKMIEKNEFLKNRNIQNQELTWNYILKRIKNRIFNYKNDTIHIINLKQQKNETLNKVKNHIISPREASIEMINQCFAPANTHNTPQNTTNT